MPKVKCNVLNCRYNYDLLCSKKNIDVDGIDSKNKLDTQCSSYEYLNHDNYNVEFAKMENEPTPQTEVYCDVIKCVFERGQRCHADRIVIKTTETKKDHNKHTKTTTHCETFESKD